jgi:hypothetical protein
MDLKIKAVIYGSSAVIIVLLLNLLVLSLLGFPIMAMEIIKKYLILIVLLIAGFGFQVGLFTYFNGLNAISCSTTVVSGSISGTSMILCCSHYILNLLPFLGAFIGVSFLSGLSKYIPYFLWLGIFSNIIGIGVLFYQKNKYRTQNHGK